MKISEALEYIQPTWTDRVSHRLASERESRENFEQALDRFFHFLQQAIAIGDSGWLHPILDEWIQARTQTDLEARANRLPGVLDQMLLAAFEICQEKLEPVDAVLLLGALLPVFLEAGDYAVRQESKLLIGHISQELDQANATLERLDKSKSDFISIAAHELKTPLTLIEGYTAMLREQLPRGEIFDSARILLKGVDNGTRRLQEIVDDMIDVSLIDNNLLSLHFQPVWINRLFRVILEEFNGVISERRQKLVVQEFAGFSEMTFGDEERLFQAFRNLLSNAIKYTPDGGQITVGGRKLPGFIEITLTDSGIGIDLEDQTRIFEKFGRLGNVSLHSSGKTKFKGGGPGLGLPITKGIIEAHGGAIWVESQGFDDVNYPGSTFHVLLPLRKVPPDDRVAKLFSPLPDDNPIFS